MSSSAQSFGKIRSFLFPIYNHEFKKFFAFAGIMFCMIMNYTLLRNMKDVLVVNAAGAGIITFLKTYCVTPAAILFFISCSKWLALDILQVRYCLDLCFLWGC